jgi:hypothetical protein
MLDKFGNKVYAQRKHETIKPKELPLNQPDIVNGKELLSFSEKLKQSNLPKSNLPNSDVPF